MQEIVFKNGLSIFYMSLPELLRARSDGGSQAAMTVAEPV